MAGHRRAPVNLRVTTALCWARFPDTQAFARRIRSSEDVRCSLSEAVAGSHESSGPDERLTNTDTVNHHDEREYA
jgi:hypothetical protein